MNRSRGRPQVSTQLYSVQERLRYWRAEMKQLSLREFQAAVNACLAPERRVSLGSVSNYEQRPGAARSASPRAEYVAAVKAAFPEVRLEWLLLGAGEPTSAAERVSEAVGGTEEMEPGEVGLAGRVRADYPDLALLSPEASALFIGSLTRYAMGEPGLDLTEDRILELAADLRWILFLPAALWGFRHLPEYDRFSAYAVAMLHALMLAMPGPGEGDRIAAYTTAPNRRLRAVLEVGFAATPASEEGLPAGMPPASRS